MDELHSFEEEKLIMGVIYNDEAVFAEVMDILKQRFGDIDGECEAFSFSREFSSYYDDELGGEGIRKIF